MTSRKTTAKPATKRSIATQSPNRPNAVTPLPDVRPYLTESSVFADHIKRDRGCAIVEIERLEAEINSIRERAEVEIAARGARMADLNLTVGGADAALTAMSSLEGDGNVVKMELESRA